MKTLNYLLLVHLLFLSVTLKTQASDTITSTAFTPGGKPFVKIFSNVHTDFDGDNTAFQVQRAYFGYAYDLSPVFSSKLTLDVGSPEVSLNDTTEVNTSLQMTAYLKTASLTYEKNGFEASFGLIGLKQHKLEEKYWGHRYIFKSFQDEHSISTSADLGFWLTYEVTEFLTIDGVMRNGEGYKKLQADNKYLYGGAFTIEPLEGLVFRGYYDYSKNEESQTTIAHFLGYQTNTFTVGTSYNMQNNQDYVKENHVSGFSVFSHYSITEFVELFARYDQVTFDVSDEISGDQLIGGVQLSPVKGVTLALNYQGWLPASQEVDSEHYLYLNCQVAF